VTDLRVPAEHDIAGVDRGVPFEFLFEGRPVKAYSGETVGAALTAAGITMFRTTRQGARPRGIFCGIGICFDCLVVVDGRPNVRACVTAARAGMDVRVQNGSAGDVYGVRD
jgi:predicted molibdopterin-dependent oxidoreductase YjgC